MSEDNTQTIDDVRPAEEDSNDAPPSRRRIPQIQFVDPSIRENYEAGLPSREERRENLNNLHIQCSNVATCGKYAPRSDLRVCSRCKDVRARYCSQECQKTHWRTEHKAQCKAVDGGATSKPKNLALKLAERAFGSSKIMQFLYFHSILTLELLEDRSNASRYAVNVECSTTPADLTASMGRLLAGLEPDPNAQVCLSYTSLTRVPLEEAPERTRKALEEATKNFYASPLIEKELVIVLYFTTKEGGGLDGSTSFPVVLTKKELDYMANDPKEILRSALTGDTEVKMTAQNLREFLNNEIRMDRQNKLRLRYPSTI
ncbi:hypothetical protein BJ138DRAFT_1094787 [Hygrophoropsis aurantiaca]|uniref:Uncharacterized protein n=1 Tax=Hygrophoropsis aurantiaca TaxID=72124 RepID=A0ACB7ZYH2_9AGAM|nr:hypothetical protein BJ138DRAFT_1094787 [Hygrophoropsis aurantiaca]